MLIMFIFFLGLGKEK